MLSKYYKHSRMKDGHLNICIDCTRKRVASHREKNIDRIRKYDRDRGKDPARIAAAVEYNRAYRKKNKLRTRAHQMVSYHVRKGTLKRKPCEVCGKNRTEAHHPDYNYPLDVVWLCSVHHKEAHA